MAKPIAVIAGDIHYSLTNLPLADRATRMAIAKANELNVPFIANGDTTDTKANLRAECVNAMIDTFKTAKLKSYVNIGNHCKINNKSSQHALNFLEPFAHIVDTPTYSGDLKSFIVPYHDDVKELRLYLAAVPKESRVILHQGLLTGNAGEYIQDHSALTTEDLADFRTILSHYHARQDIKCGRPRPGTIGLASYVGSPYTTSYGEATDPEKGFQILMDDGTLEFVPTKLRRHIVLNVETHKGNYQITGKVPLVDVRNIDLVKVKFSGTSEGLATMTKEKLSKALGLPEFKLDLIPTAIKTSTPANVKLTNNELLDSLIDNLDTSSPEQKERLKTLWKDLK